MTNTDIEATNPEIASTYTQLPPQQVTVGGK